MFPPVSLLIKLWAYNNSLQWYVENLVTFLFEYMYSKTYLHLHAYIICLQAVCPVCREHLPEEIVSNIDARDFRDSTDTDEEEAKYVPSEEVVEMRQKMSELYQQQLQKGGIIDLEAERNKYLIPKVIVVIVIYCHST